MSKLTGVGLETSRGGSTSGNDGSKGGNSDNSSEFHGECGLKDRNGVGEKEVCLTLVIYQPVQISPIETPLITIVAQPER